MLFIPKIITLLKKNVPIKQCWNFDGVLLDVYMLEQELEIKLP